MRIDRSKTAELVYDASQIVSGVDHVLGSNYFESDLNAKDCYDLAHKLERALHMLIAAGDRKVQESLDAGLTETF